MNAPHTSPSNVAGWRRRDRITAYTSACPSNTTRPANHANGPFPITSSASTAMARRPPLATAAVRLRPSGPAPTGSSTTASAPSCQLGASTGSEGSSSNRSSAETSSGRSGSASSSSSRPSAISASSTPSASSTSASAGPGRSSYAGGAVRGYSTLSGPSGSSPAEAGNGSGSPRGGP